MPPGHLSFTVYGARNLKDTKLFGKQNIQLVIYCGYDYARSIVFKKAGTDPELGSAHEFNIVDIPELVVQVVSVKDSDELIGTARIPLNTAYQTGRDHSSAPVLSGSGKPHGEILYRLVFTPAPNGYAPQPQVSAVQSNGKPGKEGYEPMSTGTSSMPAPNGNPFAAKPEDDKSKVSSSYTHSPAGYPPQPYATGYPAPGYPASTPAMYPPPPGYPSTAPTSYPPPAAPPPGYPGSSGTSSSSSQAPPPGYPGTSSTAAAPAGYPGSTSSTPAGYPPAAAPPPGYPGASNSYPYQQQGYYGQQYGQPGQYGGQPQKPSNGNGGLLMGVGAGILGGMLIGSIFD